ncbi:SCO1/SenC-domain-containing protein [Limtongia smithiae]|uniref:SCO1/SenC-domain-containing protein n=1 Tax=Limtongia smithiae TaxID=1125753 RepID=UPI0034CFF96A
MLGLRFTLAPLTLRHGTSIVIHRAAFAVRIPQCSAAFGIRSIATAESFLRLSQRRSRFFSTTSVPRKDAVDKSSPSSDAKASLPADEESIDDLVKSFRRPMAEDAQAARAEAAAEVAAEVKAEAAVKDESVKATASLTTGGEEKREDPLVIRVSRKAKKNPLGFFNVGGMVIFLLGLAMLISYRRRVQKAVDAFKEERERESFGKALIGGPFQLTDQNGNLFTEDDLKNKFSLIYFGFTLCPDICPEELDKMAIIVNKLKEQNVEIQPIFITCDPLRDTPNVVKKYLEEFEIPGIVGLTGTYEEIEHTCKAYRVYFSTPPEITPGQDYIVDHSIFFYLMDPEGEFVKVYGRRYEAPDAALEIAEEVKKWLPARERHDAAFQKPSFWKFWE